MQGLLDDTFETGRRQPVLLPGLGIKSGNTALAAAAQPQAVGHNIRHMHDCGFYRVLGPQRAMVIINIAFQRQRQLPLFQQVFADTGVVPAQNFFFNLEQQAALGTAQVQDAHGPVWKIFVNDQPADVMQQP